MASGGYGCSGSVMGWPNREYTWLDLNYPINASGIYDRWCINSGASGNVKLKIFRGNIYSGASKIYDSSFKIVNSGINNFSITPGVSLLVGDYISFYSDTSDLIQYKYSGDGEIIGGFGDTDVFISGDGIGNASLLGYIEGCSSVYCTFAIL